MGRYRPIIVTADCGSLTCAGKLLGYAQPNMGSIVTRVEKELGVKLFHRSQHGVALTETGARLVAIMRQIEDMEDHLQEAATRVRKDRFRVGVFQSVATQWMPQVAAAFCKRFPDVVFQMDHLGRDLDSETGVRENALDCAFFRGTNYPEGLRHVPLITEPFYLLVPADSPLADEPMLSLREVAGRWPYIQTGETFDWEEPFQDVRQRLMERDVIKVSAPEDSTVITLVSQGLGVSVLPRLSLSGIAPGQRVRAVPLEDGPVRTISLLLPKKTERSSCAAWFLALLQKRVAEWGQETGLV